MPFKNYESGIMNDELGWQVYSPAAARLQRKAR